MYASTYNVLMQAFMLYYRAGKMTGVCKIVDGSAVELNMYWGEPFAGRGRDIFRWVFDSSLTPGKARHAFSKEWSQLHCCKGVCTSW